MQTALPAPLPVPHAPLPVPAAPATATGRHTAPTAPGRRRRLRALLALLVAVVGSAATAATLLLPGADARRLDAALDQFRQWPSISVDGYLTDGGDPVRVAATLTADGAASGLLGRSGDARAEFVVGPDGALLRGNVAWWRATEPDRAALLAGRWVRDPHDTVVDQITRGRLAPRALTDALADLRDPAQRTRAEVVVNGASGTSFVRPGARLVVGRDGRPMALATVLGGAPDAMITFRAGPALGAGASDPATPVTATLAVALPDPAVADAVRKVAADAAAQEAAQESDRDRSGSDPAPGDGQAGAPSPVGIDGRPDPAGCRPSGCTVRYRLRNGSDATVMGLFTVRVDGLHVVAARSLTLPPHTSLMVGVEIPARIVAAHPDGKVKLDARFTPYGDV